MDNPKLTTDPNTLRSQSLAHLKIIEERHRRIVELIESKPQGATISYGEFAAILGNTDEGAWGLIKTMLKHGTISRYKVGNSYAYTIIGPIKTTSASKTTCKNGHPWIPSNIYVRPDGFTECKPCLLARVNKKNRHYPSEVKIWGAMIRRCTNQKDHGYEYYGGRGIRVCQRWRKFWNFYADMGPRPSPGHTIDRKDRNGHYSCGKCSECIANGWPANCEWATYTQQNHHLGPNRRNTSGYTGVIWDKYYNKWSARIGHEGKTVNLGYFRRLEDAVAARKKAEEKYGYS